MRSDIGMLVVPPINFSVGGCCSYFLVATIQHSHGRSEGTAGGALWLAQGTTTVDRKYVQSNNVAPPLLLQGSACNLAVVFDSLIVLYMYIA